MIRNSRTFAVVCTLVLFSAAAFAGGPLWTYKDDIKWHKLTAAGTIIIGGDHGLTSLDPDTGKPTWQRKEFEKITAYQVEEVLGTPFLLASKNASGKTTLTALDILTGNTLWETEKLKGAAIGVFPDLERDMVLILTTRGQGDTKTKPDIIALKLSDGTALWEADFPDKFDLHMAEASGRWSPRFDLSGHQDPVFDKDAIYFTYAGLHKYDINTGKLLWSVPYDVTEGKLKRGNAQAVIDGDLVYTSSKGQLRAIDKATGQVKWTSPDYGAAVAEMQLKGDVIYGRMGGTFYDYNDKEWKLKKPLGVVAVNKANGTTRWKYDKADDAITNLMLLEDSGTILIGDAKNLIGINTDSAKEEFRIKVEFKNKVGAGAAAWKVARFGLGGIRGGMKGLSDDKKAEDVPVNISMQNGLAVVRGRQHILAFDPKTKAIAWSNQFAAPGFSGWQRFAMAAITAASYYANTMSASNTYMGTYENTRANEARQNDLRNFSKLMNTRFSAVKSTDRYVYMLTNLEIDKEKGAGLVGVNLASGQPDYQLLIKDKEPEYVVDEQTGRLYNLRDNEIQAFAIR